MPTERHLLFAVLAFENDLIDLAQLTAACRAWAADKSKPLADVLVERGWLTADDRAFVDKAVDRKLAKHQNNPRVTLNAITRGDVSEAIKEVDDADVQRSLSSWPSAGPVLIETIGETRTQTEQPKSRYTWLSEVGKGGLGKVWLARDNELAREVALKEIKQGASSASQEAMRRLIKEAQITGQLQHPNIVPVYEVNRGGRPFYTMKLVKGETLTKVIRSHHEQRRAGQLDPLSLPKLLNVFVNICDALAYAHSRGIIHRDLKPENIILGEYGEAIVLDWGLAKQVDSSEEESSPVVLTDDAISEATRAGATPGTLPYMAPEQARGRVDQMDQQTDIYGLGAILFEILTSEAPHKLVVADTPSEAATQAVDHLGRIARYLSQIADGPTPLARERDPSVSVVLNAVCGKAMARTKSERYVTAKDLAADVQRFLADEPVSVLQDPLSIRTQRWMKRHRTLVAATAATLLVGVVSLGLLVAITARHAAEVEDKNLALQQANTKEREATQLAAKRATENAALAQQEQVARQLAERNAAVAGEQSQLALSTLNSVIFDLQRALQNVPGGAAVRQRLLVTALEKLDQVSTVFAAKLAIEHSSIGALIELADAFVQLGQVEQVGNGPHLRSATLSAERLYSRANEMALELTHKKPNDPFLLSGLSITHSRLGDIYLKLGRTDDTMTHIQAGLKINRMLSEVAPSDSQFARNLSISMNRLGDLYLKLGRSKDALAQFQEVMNINRGLVEAKPKGIQAQSDLANSFDKLGDTLLTLGRTNDALVEFQKALEIRRMLVEVAPDDVENQRNLSISYGKLGSISLSLGEVVDALTQFQESLKIRRTLAASDPHSTQSLSDLVISLNEVGETLLKLGRPNDAIIELQDAHKITSSLAESDANDVEKQRDLSISLNKLGDAFQSLGRTNDALSQFEGALRIRRKLADADPKNAQQQRDLSVSLERVGEVLLKQGRTTEALALFQENLVVSRRLVETDAGEAQKQRGLSVSLQRIGDTYLKLGRATEALASYQEGLSISQTLASADPNSAQKLRELSFHVWRVGDAALSLGRTDQALSQYQEYEKISRTLSNADPTDASKQRELSISLQRLGDALLKLDLPDEALKRFEETLKITRVLAEANPRNADSQHELMIAHHRLAQVHSTVGRYDETSASLKEAINVLDLMIENGQLVDSSRNEKAALQLSIQTCMAAKFVTGDWDTLLKVDPKLLPQLLLLRATEMVKRRDFSQVLQALAKLRELEPPDKHHLYNAARVYGRCAKATMKDEDAATSAKNSEKPNFVQLALRSLNDSIAAGFDDFVHLREDEDLALLRGLPEFEALFPKKTN